MTTYTLQLIACIPLNLLGFFLPLYLVLRIRDGHQLVRDIVCPSLTRSENYAADSDWRR